MIEALLADGLRAMGIPPPPGAAEQLDKFARALLEKNRVMNLTAITEPEAVARLHMLDCAALLRFAEFEGASLIDVGAGAGFPGVPLKVLAPSLSVTLLDSQGKRVDWLNGTCQSLGLADIRAVHGRAEELGRAEEFRERFDFAAARAVASLPVLCELCLPFVKPGGRFLAMKGVDSQAELDASSHALQVLGGEVESVNDYEIPGNGIFHRLVVIYKNRPTPEKYPRAFGKIKKSPL